MITLLISLLFTDVNSHAELSYIVEPESFGTNEIFRFRARNMKSIISKSGSLMSEDLLLKSPFEKEEQTEDGSFQKLFSQLVIIYEPFNIKTLREGIAKVQDKTVDQNLVEVLTKFGQLNDKRAASVLFAFASSPVEQLRCVALENIGWLKVPETFSLMLEKVENIAENVQVRISSVMGLANYGGVAAARELTEQLKIEKNKEVILAIHKALEKLGGKPDFRFNARTHEIKAGVDNRDPSVLVW